MITFVATCALAIAGLAIYSIARRNRDIRRIAASRQFDRWIQQREEEP